MKTLKYIKNGIEKSWIAAGGAVRGLAGKAMKKEPGIDGILVTVGLCIIALLLCVVMKESLTDFITTIVEDLTTEAQKILTGVTK